MDLEIDTSQIDFVSCGIGRAMQMGYNIPAEFVLMDGPMAWLDRDAEKQELRSFADCSPENERVALRTFITKDAGMEIFHRMVEHFANSLQRNPIGKAFVVARSVEQVRSLTDEGNRLGLKTVSAYYDDKEAGANIEAFKYDPAVKILIGIALVHEGLNCPQGTHLAYLTSFRTLPHATQALGRPLRPDRSPMALPIEEQKAFIFAPKDPLLLRLLERIRAEDGRFASEVIQVTEESGESARLRANVAAQALRSAVHESSVYDLKTGMMLTPDTIKSLFESAGTPLSSEQTEVLNRFDEDRKLSTKNAPVTPKEEQSQLRSAIEQMVRQCAADLNLRAEDLNAHIKGHFKKGRGDMTNEELKQVHQFVSVRLEAPSLDDWRGK